MLLVVLVERPGEDALHVRQHEAASRRLVLQLLGELDHVAGVDARRRQLAPPRNDLAPNLAGVVDAAPLVDEILADEILCERREGRAALARRGLRLHPRLLLRVDPPLDEREPFASDLASGGERHDAGIADDALRRRLAARPPQVHDIALLAAVGDANAKARTSVSRYSSRLPPAAGLTLSTNLEVNFFLMVGTRRSSSLAYSSPEAKRDFGDHGLVVDAERFTAGITPAEPSEQPVPLGVQTSLVCLQAGESLEARRGEHHHHPPPRDYGGTTFALL